LAYGWGWTENQFLNSRPEILFKTWKGRQDEIIRSGEWERLRMLGAWILAPHQKKGANLTPQKLLPLPWDPAPETKSEWLEKNKHLTPIWEKLERAK
jgi:hypothetical protein